MLCYAFSSVLVDRGSFRGQYYTTRGHASCLPRISWDLQTKKTAALCSNEVETQNTNAKNDQPRSANPNILNT
jgi:hypothetical protein